MSDCSGPEHTTHGSDASWASRISGSRIEPERPPGEDPSRVRRAPARPSTYRSPPESARTRRESHLVEGVAFAALVVHPSPRRVRQGAVWWSLVGARGLAPTNRGVAYSGSCPGEITSTTIPSAGHLASVVTILSAPSTCAVATTRASGRRNARPCIARKAAAAARSPARLVRPEPAAHRRTGRSSRPPPDPAGMGRRGIRRRPRLEARARRRAAGPPSVPPVPGHGAGPRSRG